MPVGNKREAPPLTIGFPGEADVPLFRTGAVTLLTGYVVVLMCIPSALVLAPLGGAGSPATLLAAVLAIWCLLLWLHPAAGLARRPQPARAAALAFACVTIASYVSANRRDLPTLQQNGADRGMILVLGWTGVLVLAADGISGWEGLSTLLRRPGFLGQKQGRERHGRGILACAQRAHACAQRAHAKQFHMALL